LFGWDWLHCLVGIGCIVWLGLVASGKGRWLVMYQLSATIFYPEKTFPDPSDHPGGLDRTNYAGRRKI
jgi:hypothetical protein